MGGFVALTTQEWISSISELTTEKAVFWRKRKTFKAICKGEPFYFLKRGHFETNNDRYIVGKGTFCELEVLPATEAWKKYGNALGYANEKSFLDVVTKMYKETNPELGCLVMEKIKMFSNPVSLAKAEIDFSPYIVSGKKISSEDCETIDRLSLEVYCGR